MLCPAVSRCYKGGCTRQPLLQQRGPLEDVAGRVRVTVITLAHSRVLAAKLLLRPGERNMALAACHGDPAPPTSA